MKKEGKGEKKKIGTLFSLFLFLSLSLSLPSKRGPTLFSFTHEIQVHLRWNIGIVCLARGGRMISPLPYHRFWLPYYPTRLRPGEIGKRDRQSGRGAMENASFQKRAFPGIPCTIERTTNTKQWCIPVEEPPRPSRDFWSVYSGLHPSYPRPQPLSNARRRYETDQQINANLLNIYVPPRRHRPRNIFPLFYSAACQYWAPRRNGLFGCLLR